MTLVKRSKYWSYDFWYREERYQGTTEQTSRDEAARVESKIKERLRLDVWDLAPATREDTPTFSAWAERVLAEKRKRLKRADLLERNLRMVLAFFGTRPTQSPPVAGGMYHALHLADPILDPEWIDRFDAWMTTRGLSGSTKNSYRSAASGLYKLALKPRWRKLTRIKDNPFLNIDRDRPRRRRVKLPIVKLHAWLDKADPHVLLAVSIGALAPKLRLQQVLALRFDEHLDADLQTITFDDFKSSAHRDEPQQTAISRDLRLILLAIRQARPESMHVITYQGNPVQSIKRALKSSATESGLTWGIKTGGVTFHALRHAMATELARMGVSRLLVGRALDHADPRTTEKHYIDLEVDDERAVMDQLADRLAIGARVVKAVGTFAGGHTRTLRRMRGKDRKPRTVPKRGPRKVSG